MHLGRDRARMRPRQALRRLSDTLFGSQFERGLARAKELSWRACGLGNLAVYREVLAELRQGA